MQAQISIAIPTHNRPEWLRAAVASIGAQSVKPHEIIIVDDASEPPVAASELATLISIPIRVIRNNLSRGLAWNRHIAVSEAAAEYVLPLDDDDLLDRLAVERISDLLEKYPDTEVVFLGVKGFGPRADYFNRVQPEGTQKLLQITIAQRLDGNAYAIQGDFSEALLAAVPQSFQHPVVKKSFWNAVTQLRNEAYAKANGIDDIARAFELIKGPLRDSEWAIYCSFGVNHALLVDEGLYQMRCEGQGAVSNPGQRVKHTSQILAIKRTLSQAVAVCERLKPYRKQVANALSNDLFSVAYYCYSENKRCDAWRNLLASARIAPTMRHLKLGLKLLAP